LLKAGANIPFWLSKDAENPLGFHRNGMLGFMDMCYQLTKRYPKKIRVWDIP
jgi:hypothetical protein